MNLQELLAKVELDNAEFSDWGTGASGLVRVSDVIESLHTFFKEKSCLWENGTHELTEIHSVELGGGVSRVVRWCAKCGAVVVDTDFDGRVKPGDVVAMKHPEMSLTVGGLFK